MIHNPNPRNPLVQTSPLALSIVSPTVQANQYPYKKDEYSLDMDIKEKFVLNEGQISTIEDMNISCTISNSNEKSRQKNDNITKNTSSKVIQGIKMPTVNDLPEIPKFGKKISNFPIVKRLPSSSNTTKNIIVPKLSSLEIFNPEIDDSDSSDDNDDELSSPDSIDSVINKNILTNDHNSESVSLLCNSLNKDSTEYDCSNEEQEKEFCENIDFNSYCDHFSDILSEKRMMLANIKETYKTPNLLTNLTGSTQNSKRQNYQQQQKVTDFILEENEDTEEEIVSIQLLPDFKKFRVRSKIILTLFGGSPYRETIL